MSKTPRTDDREFAAIDVKPSSRVVYASFARQLEAELADKDKQLAEARAEIEMLKHQLEDESMRADGMTTAHAEACAKNYRQQELIEQIRSALGRIADELEPSEHDIRGCMFKACKWCDARAALSAAERGG